jgi:hypothetical protein
MFDLSRPVVHRRTRRGSGDVARRRPGCAGALALLALVLVTPLPASAELLGVSILHFCPSASGASGALLDQFFAFDGSFAGGVFVAYPRELP